LSTGDELVEGLVAERNAAGIAAALGGIGLRVAASHIVGDDNDEIKSLLGEITRRADACICTGGLGPTGDDLIREAVAEVCGVKLSLDNESLEAIRRIFSGYGREMPESNHRQAMFPDGSEIIPNNFGTAPGFAVECGKALVVCMPGVPREMRKMLGRSVISIISKRFPLSSIIRTKVLRLFGTSESSLADVLGDMMERNRNPSVGTIASTGIISIIIRSRGTQAERALAETESRIRERLGRHIFGEGEATLEQAVVDIIEKHNMTIATAESCTGGMIGSLLTNVPGVSRHFIEGIICYSDEAKVELLGVPPRVIQSKGAVSDEVARALAEGVRKTARTDIGLGVTGIAGPAGDTSKKPVGLVYIAVLVKGEMESREFRFSGDRRSIRLRSAMTALNMVRHRLLDIDETG